MDIGDISSQDKRLFREAVEGIAASVGTSEDPLYVRNSLLALNTQFSHFPSSVRQQIHSCVEGALEGIASSAGTAHVRVLISRANDCVTPTNYNPSDNDYYRGDLTE